MPCDDCLSRRDFLATAAGAAGFVAIGGCGDGFITGPPTMVTLPTGPFQIAVSDFPGLGTVGVLVRIGDTGIAVKRVDATSFEAFSMRCTHQGCATSITNGQQFDCGCHGSRFDSDGNVVRGPATTPLAQFTTTYDPATDQLTIS